MTTDGSLPPAVVPPPGAKCAAHRDADAQAVCGRCGAFMCSGCSAGLENSTGQCPACRGLTGSAGFPFRRDGYAVTEVIHYGYTLWKTHWVLLMVGVVAVGVAAMVGGVFRAFGGLFSSSEDGGAALIGMAVMMLVGQIVGQAAQGVVQMGLIQMCLDAIRGRKVDANSLWVHAPKVLRYLALNLLVLFAVVVALMATFGAVFAVAAWRGGAFSGESLETAFSEQVTFLIVGCVVFGLVMIPAIIYCTIPFQFALAEMVAADCGPIEALERSFRLVDGHRWPVLLMMLLNGVIVIAGVMLCFVGIVPAVGCVNLIVVAMYHALRKGSTLPALPEHEAV